MSTMRLRSQGFYQMNDDTEWHMDAAPKGAPESWRVLRVIRGGKVILRRVVDEHDAQQLANLFEGRMYSTTINTEENHHVKEDQREEDRHQLQEDRLQEDRHASPHHVRASRRRRPGR